MDFLELELGADIDARLHSWQVSVYAYRLECTRSLGELTAIV